MADATETIIRQKYPQMAWALNIPEVADKLRQAAANGWGPEELQGAIATTNWWRDTTPAIRRFDALVGEDPNAAEQAIQSKQREVEQIAIAMGYDPFKNNLWARHIAYMAARFQWDDTLIKRFIADENKTFRGEESLTGTIGEVFRSLKAEAADWGVGMSDATLWGHALSMMTGDNSREGMTTMFKSYAKSLFPSIADDIDRGVTVAQYFDPYKEMAVRELGIHPEEISLLDEKWRRALVTVDPKTGQRVPMGLDYWLKELRTNSQYGWDFTAAAKNQAAQFATGTLERLGIL